MSGRQAERGRGRGRGDSGQRGRGSQFQVSSFDSRGRGRGGGAVSKQIFSHGSGDVPSQPNIKVQETENETARSLQQSKSASGSKKPLIEQRMPPRPGYGTQGKGIILWANYFEMVAPMDLMLYRYSIDIKADEAGRKPVGKKIKRIVELLIEEHFSQNQSDIATDYKSNLISKSEVPLEKAEYRVQYRSDGEDEPPQKPRTYVLRLQQTGTFRMSDFMDYLTSSNASALFASKEETIQALNIVMGHYPKSASHIYSVGANKHFPITPAPTEQMSLGAGLKAVRGFFISARPATSRLLLNVQVKHSACYEEGPLGRLMKVFLGQNNGNMVKLAHFLKKVRVQITHIVRKNKAGKNIPRIKVITNLAMPNDGNSLQYPPKVPRFAAGPRETEFFLTPPGEPTGSQQSPAKGKGKRAKAGPEPPSSGRYVSVYNFFKSNYNITIEDATLPIINVGTRENPLYLPVDVCQVVPGQASNSKLTPNQTKQMINFAVRQPAQNAHSIVVNGARLLGIEPKSDTTINQFSLNITPRLITVPGRVLTGPSVKYKNGQTVRVMSGSWNMNEVQLSTRSSLPNWTYLLLVPQKLQYPWEQQLPSVLATFQTTLKRVGIDIANHTPGLRYEFNPANVEVDIDAAVQRFVSHPTRPAPKLLFVIIPYEDQVIYNRIKFACDVKHGLLNVCAFGPKFAKANDQYCSNVALKFNLKLGGRNQYLDNAKLGIIAEGKTMVVGIDVTHPSPGSTSNAPSVAGIVASIDPWLGQWPADIQIQQARQEMVSGLDGMLKSRLRLWAKHNKGRLPENILVYRDGVSEGQYSIVLDQELPLLRKACKETYPATDSQKGLPRITLIVVGKRHNTRFFPTKEQDSDNSSNPRNGTVVDRGVTEARNWEFFLQAHTALKGTARPAHYFIVLDEIFRDRKVQLPFQNVADVLEDLTHNMCYLFGRATKAVSVCPPAYYADLVCERARCYLGKLFDGSSAGSVSDGGGRSEPDASSVAIHEKVRDSMFYI